LNDTYLRQRYLALSSSPTLPAALAKPPLDGNQLHHRVPSSHWCVTLDDIVQFRRVVERALERSAIVPTSMDDFDPEDDSIGPSIFTVNQQLIMPVTADFGSPSWALMMHPDGLECDLFLTHCWSEGIFEFLDKVMHSWPRRARYAYCCFLSNPQNLDIGKIISQPSASPFALALTSARCLLVVPNSTCSIYTRIWCVYEAFLAHSQGIPIFTATTPARDASGRVCTMLAFSVVCCCSSLVVFHSMYLADIPWLAYVFITLAAMFTLLSLCLPAESWQLRRVNDMGAMMCSILVGHCISLHYQGIEYGLLDVVSARHAASMFALSMLFFVAREVDRLWQLQASRELCQLKSGFTGRLQDARSSAETDREHILFEIRSRHQESAVEHAINVLISAGMSTPTLRFAASCGVDIGGAGWWSLAQVVIVVSAFIAHPLSHAILDHSCTGSMGFVPWVKFVEGVAWAMFFKTAGMDQRGFGAAVAVKLGVVPYYIVWTIWFTYHLVLGDQGRHTSCLPDQLGAFLWGPVMLVASLGGIGSCAAIPACGGRLTNSLLHWRLPACRPGSRWADDQPSDSSDGDEIDSSGNSDSEADCPGSPVTPRCGPGRG